jgi:peptidoglycan/xylan/chitin deacetylase (PgdA/CDA1 family)
MVQRGLPLYCGGGRGRFLALTFDDGPGVYTRLAIQILQKARARATFFVVGRNLAGRRRLILAEERLGEVGDHTWTHRFLPALPPGAIRAELRRTQRAIGQTGQRVLFFRPPYGGRNAVVDATARSLNLAEALWSIDSRDSLGAGWRQIAANVIDNIRPGSIVLMHENRGQTIRALRYLILPALRARHFVTVTLTQLLQLDPPTQAQLDRGYRGCLPARQPLGVGRGSSGPTSASSPAAKPRLAGA